MTLDAHLTSLLAGQDAYFCRLVADQDVRLPLRLSDEDIGVVLDADGRDVFTVDVNGERPDGQATAIAELIVIAINFHARFLTISINTSKDARS